MTNNQSPSLPATSQETSRTPFPLPAQAGSQTPDSNPPWGLVEAFVVWLISVVLLFFVPLLTLIPYVLYRFAAYGFGDGLRVDQQTIILVSIVGVIPSHLLSMGVVWLVVTDRGRRPFWKMLGWHWPRNLGPWKSIGLAVLLLGIGWVITTLIGGRETHLDQIIKSSPQARWMIAFLAVATAPLVEEVIYRGVVFGALQKALNTFWSVVIVSVMFLGVHILQYAENLGVLAVITILSITLTLVRALTGSLLPCFVIHLVFNGIQSLILLLQPWLERYLPSTRQTEAFQLIESLVRISG